MTKSNAIAALVAAISVISSGAALGDGKAEDGEAKPFQTDVLIEFGETGARSDVLEVPADGKTIVLQHVSCSMSRSPSASKDAAFQVWVYDANGYRNLILDSGMEISNAVTPGYGGKPFYGGAFVQACAGKKCQNPADNTYDGFALEATREDYSRPEQMSCLLTGILYE